MSEQKSERTTEQKTAETVRLGTTDLYVSPLGIGTWAWGDWIVWGYGQGGYTDEDLQAAFRAALDAGITLFDTAELYGVPYHTSEKLLGRFMQGTPEPVMVATKFFPLPWRFMKSQLISALRHSLERLQITRVDLYQIHWPAPPGSIETWMDALADAVQAGYTRTVGVSNYSAAQMRRAHAALAKRGIPLASNQVHYSLLTRDPEHNGVMAACRDLGISLIAYSPLGMGMLSGKYTPDNPPPGRRGRQFSRDYLASLQPLIGLLREIGTAHGGKTPSQVALNWTICKDTIPIPGAKNVRQVQENVAALGWRLAADEVAALDVAADKVGKQ